MDYDPIKDRLARSFAGRPWVRSLLMLMTRQVFLRELEIRRHLRRLHRQGFRPQRILDAGTGYGQYTLFLRRLFPEAEIVAIDIKQAALDGLEEYCRRRGIQGIRYQQADLLKLEFEAEFDLILNVDVMEHILDDEAVFARFARALRPGGRLVLHTPAVPESMPEEEVEHGEFSVGEHVREGYKHSVIRRRVLQNGFARADVHSTYGKVGGVAWRLGVRWPMRMLSVSHLLLPLVAIWETLWLIPVRLLNELELRVPKTYGGCLLLEATKEKAEG